VYRLVGNPDDAADCVQETFLSAMRHGNSKQSSIGALSCTGLRPPGHWIACGSGYQMSAIVSRSRWIGQVFRIFVSIRSGWRKAQNYCKDCSSVGRTAQATGRGILPALSGRIGIPRDRRDCWKSMRIRWGALLHRARESLRQMLSNFVAPEE